MNYRQQLKKIYDRLVIQTIKNTEDIPDVNKWYALLKKAGHDNDPVSESYRKHICRMSYFSPVNKVTINILSLLYLICQPYHVVNKGIRKGNPDTALLIEREIPSKDIFPEKLRDIYKNIEVLHYDSLTGRILTKEAQRLYSAVKKRYRFHPYYLLQLKQSLSVISNCILNGTFRALIVYDSERDVASPVITEWLEANDIEYISFMHGEYLLQLIQAHMSFSKYYVWNKAYIEMFSGQLRCNIGEYKCYTPRKLQKKWEIENVPPVHYLTYYLSGESTKTLDSLSVIFKKLREKGLVCKLRPHPRYSHYSILKSKFDPEVIEDPKTVELKDSLSSARYIAGLSTTVLSEAYVEGREIAIDDITDLPHYQNLKDRYCMALLLPHILLSKLIAENGITLGDVDEEP